MPTESFNDKLNHIIGKYTNHNLNQSLRKKTNKQFSSGNWSLSLWDAKEYPEFAINDSRLYNKVTKVLNEIISTEKNTVNRPEQFTICANNKSVTAMLNKSNILPNLGMNEMAKRGTGESSSVNLAHAIGTDGTTPTLADESLGTELFRKVIGTKQVVNQTEQYSTAITGTEIPGVPQNIVEAGIFTSLLADEPILIAHVTFTVFVLSISKIFLILTNISHKNGTQI